jgi:hypothetical protein
MFFSICHGIVIVVPPNVRILTIKGFLHIFAAWHMHGTHVAHGFTNISNGEPLN